MSEGLVQRAITNLKKRRQNLLDGKINSIPSPFKRFSYDFPGLEQGVYYGITSYTKGSKTQFTLNLLFEALVYAIEHPNQLKLRVFFYNFEETDEKIMNRFQSWILARVDKIRISPQNLRSTRNDSPLPIEILNKLESENYKKYFDAFEESFVFSSTANPTGILKECRNYAEANGTVYKKKVEYSDTEIFDYYEPNDPTEYRIIVLDHIGIIDLERGMNKKEAIDKTSEYLAKYLRNRYGFTSIVIQQQNTSGESNDSVKLGRIRPSGANLADSTYTQKDQNVLFGLFNPYKYSLPEYMGYDIRRLKDHFRFLEVVVNRDGELGGICPLFFDGATCSFFEMPLPDNKAELEKVYKYAESLDKPKKVETTLFSWFKKLNIFKVKTN